MVKKAKKEEAPKEKIPMCKHHIESSLHLVKCNDTETHSVHLESLIRDGALTHTPYMNYLVMANHASMMPDVGVYFTSSVTARDYIQANYPNADFRLIIAQVTETNGK